MTSSKEQQNNPSVVVKKIIKASMEKVFDAWTKPELMQLWMVGRKGKAIVSNNLCVGGTYQNKMSLEVDCNNVQDFNHFGEYLEIVPPEKLVFTWNSDVAKNTRVTVELKSIGDATEVTITHELLEHDQLISHTEGWTYALFGLSLLLEA